MALDINGLYSEAERNRLVAFATAKRDSQKRLQNNLDSIASTYRGNVTQAQTAARITALGQEEKLAAAGLNSGGSSAAPRSGYTESARIASDNTLRSNLNALALSRMQKEQYARNTSESEIMQAEQAYYSDLSDLNAQRVTTTVNQYNKDRDYALSERQFDYNKQTTAYSQAMQRWQTYGVVLPADAQILGVPAGTRTDTSTYNNAKLALERWKALLK